MSNRLVADRPTQDRQQQVIVLSSAESEALQRLLIQTLGHRVIELPTGHRNALWSVLDLLMERST